MEPPSNLHASNALDDALLMAEPERLYLALRPFVTRSVRNLLRGQSPPAEVVHDACVAAVLGRARFRGESSFGAWVHGLVARQVRTWLRAQQARRSLVDISVQSDLRSESDPESEAAASRLEDVLRSELSVLPEQQRVCFVLVRIEGLSSQDTARRVRLTPDAVRASVHRASARLRRALHLASG